MSARFRCASVSRMGSAPVRGGAVDPARRRVIRSRPARPRRPVKDPAPGSLYGGGMRSSSSSMTGLRLTSVRSSTWLTRTGMAGDQWRGLRGDVLPADESAYQGHVRAGRFARWGLTRSCSRTRRSTSQRRWQTSPEYLDNWVDLAVRQPDLAVVAASGRGSCGTGRERDDRRTITREVLSDLYVPTAAAGASRRFASSSWALTATSPGHGRKPLAALQLDLVQSCPHRAQPREPGWTEDLEAAVGSADVILTDGPGPHARAPLEPYRITAALLDLAAGRSSFRPVPAVRPRP